MRFIKQFSDYNTQDPFMIPVINEKYGIPDNLKVIFNIFYEKVEKCLLEGNYFASMDYEDDMIELKNLYIVIHNVSREDIYANSQFGIFYNNIMKNAEINIYLDINNFNKKELKKCLLHELLHIFEFYNRYKKKSKKDIQWKINQHLIDLRKKYIDVFIQDFIYHIYLSFDHEINARVSETYIVLMEDSLLSSDLMRELEKTSAWKYKEYLKNFNYNNYKINYELLKDFFIELNTYIKKYSIKNFNIHTIPNSEKDCDFLLKKYKKYFNKKSKYMENKLIKLLKEVENDLKLIDSYHVVIDETKNFSEKYVTIFDKNLKRKSKIFKFNRI